MKDYYNYNDESKLIQGIWFEISYGEQIAEREEFMLNNMYSRIDIINSSPIILEALDKVKFLNMMPDGYMTIQMVADYFEVPEKTIQTVIRRNQEELFMNDMIILRGQELKDYLGSLFATSNMKITKIRHLTLLNRRVILNIAMLLRDSRIAKFIRYTILNLLDTDNGKDALQEQLNETQKKLELSEIERAKETKRANHYQNAYNGIYPMYRDLKEYVETEESYKDRYEDLLYERGYYDHQAYANLFTY